MTKTPKRIYAVLDATTEKTRMIASTTAAAAVGFIVRNQFDSKVASATDVARFMQAGGAIENDEAPAPKGAPAGGA